MSDTCGVAWDRGTCEDDPVGKYHGCSKTYGHQIRRHQCSCGAVFLLPPPNDLLADHPMEWDE